MKISKFHFKRRIIAISTSLVLLSTMISNIWAYALEEQNENEADKSIVTQTQQQNAQNNNSQTNTQSEAITYEYYDTESNTFKTTTCTEYTEITQGIQDGQLFGTEQNITKWFVVTQNVTQPTRFRVPVNSHIHLIIKDGVTFDLKQGIRVAEGSSLTIYGQEQGTGKLIATGTYAGLGANADNGAVEASGDITIHGGIVTTTGGSNAAGIGSSHRDGAAGNITIYGGVVTATGAGSANGIGAGNGGTNYGTFSTGQNGNAIIYASSIGDKDDTSNWNGIIFEGNNGKVYGNVTLDRDLTISSNQTLTLDEGASLTINENVTLTNEGTITNNGVITNSGEINVNGNGSITNNGNINNDNGRIVVRDSASFTGIKPNNLFYQNINYVYYNETGKQSTYTSESVNVGVITDEIQTTLQEGWYYLDSNVNVASEININGEVNIILKDGATLTATAGINTSNGTLNIYGQENNTGKFIGNITGNGDLVINSGAVNDEQTQNTISSNNVTINSGIVNANTITAIQNVTISGGTINVTGDIAGTFSTTESGNAVIIANTISSQTTVQDGWKGIIFLNNQNGVMNGNVTPYTSFSIPSGKTLTINEGYTLTINSGIIMTNNGTVTVNGNLVNNGTVTNSGSGSITISSVDYKEYQYSEDIGLTEKTTTPTQATMLTSNKTTWNSSSTSGYYVVNGSVTINSRVTVSGDIKLILMDGSSLTVNGGIKVSNNNSLTIYGQNDSTGKLITNSSYTGIELGNQSTVTIHGGVINSTGGYACSGIGGGETTNTIIYNGIINSTGGTGGAGIGSGGWQTSGNVVIYGGKVTANGGSNAAGIGGGYAGVGNNISIYGGYVIANGNADAASIGGGWSSTGGNITITGGVIKANLNIGNGNGQSATTGTNFSTGNNGKAIIYTSKTILGDTNTEDDPWSGIIFQKNQGYVYGDKSLDEFDLSYLNSDGNDKIFTISSGQTLTVNDGNKLTIPNGYTLTNNGTLKIYEEPNLVGEDENTSLVGDNGTYTRLKPIPPTSNEINEPVGLVYTSQAITPTTSLDQNITVEHLTKNFTTPVEQWNKTGFKKVGTDDVTQTVTDAGNYYVVYSPGTGHTQISPIEKQFTVLQSTTTFENGVQVKDENDQTVEDNRFVCGDTIKVSVIPKATGVAVNSQVTSVYTNNSKNNELTSNSENNVQRSLFNYDFTKGFISYTLQEPTQNQIAIFVGDNQITEPQNVTSGQTYTFEINTETYKEYLVNDENSAVQLTAKYIGNSNMANHQQSVDVIVEKNTYTLGADETTLEFGEFNLGNGDYYNTPKQVTITNNGNTAVTLEIPTDINGYTITYAPNNLTIEPQGQITLTITPKTDLTPSIYNEQIVIKNTNDNTQNVTITANLTLNEQLTVSASVNDNSIVLGESVTLTGDVNGGNTDNYTYKWYVNDKLLDGETQSTLTHTPNTYGEIKYKVEVYDGIQTVTSNEVAVQVANNDYTINLSESQISFDTVNVGYNPIDSKTVTITNNGNTQVTLQQITNEYFDIKFSNTVILPTENITVTITPKNNLTSKAYSETITFTTNENSTAQLTVNLTVNPQLTVTIEGVTEIDNGTSTTLTANVQGGSGTYSYEWYKVVNGTPMLNSLGMQKSITVSPNESTTYEVVVKDTGITAYEDEVNTRHTITVNYVRVPEIQGETELEMYVGDKFDYLISANISLNINDKDDTTLTTDDIVIAKLDNTILDDNGTLLKAGTYEITYSVTDKYSNTDTHTLKLKVNSNIYFTNILGDTVYSQLPTIYARTNENIVDLYEDVKAYYDKASDIIGQEPQKVELQFTDDNTEQNKFSVTKLQYLSENAQKEDATSITQAGYYYATYTAINEDNKKLELVRGIYVKSLPYDLHGHSITVSIDDNYKTWEEFLNDYGSAIDFVGYIDVPNESGGFTKTQLDKSAFEITTDISTVQFGVQSSKAEITYTATDNDANYKDSAVVEEHFVITINEVVGLAPHIKTPIGHENERVVGDKIVVNGKEYTQNYYEAFMDETKFYDVDKDISDDTHNEYTQSPDMTAPIGQRYGIAEKGISEIKNINTDTILYSNTDNTESDFDLAVDTMINTIGRYKITYYAIDGDGNTTIVIREVYVAGNIEFAMVLDDGSYQDITDTHLVMDSTLPESQIVAYYTTPDGEVKTQSVSVKNSATVDTQTIGTYEITYQSSHPYITLPGTNGTLRDSYETIKNYYVHGEIVFDDLSDIYEFTHSGSQLVNIDLQQDVNATYQKVNENGDIITQQAVINITVDNQVVENANSFTSTTPSNYNITYTATYDISNIYGATDVIKTRLVSFTGTPIINSLNKVDVKEIITDNDKDYVIQKINASASVALPNGDIEDLTQNIDYSFDNNYETMTLSVSYKIDGTEKQMTVTKSVYLNKIKDPVIDNEDETNTSSQPNDNISNNTNNSNINNSNNNTTNNESNTSNNATTSNKNNSFDISMINNRLDTATNLEDWLKENIKILPNNNSISYSIMNDYNIQLDENGMPTTPGVYNVVVTVSDEYGNITSKTVTISVDGQPQINAPSTYEITTESSLDDIIKAIKDEISASINKAEGNTLMLNNDDFEYSFDENGNLVIKVKYTVGNETKYIEKVVELTGNTDNLFANTNSIIKEDLMSGDNQNTTQSKNTGKIAIITIILTIISILFTLIGISQSVHAKNRKNILIIKNVISCVLSLISLILILTNIKGNIEWKIVDVNTIISFIITVINFIILKTFFKISKR